MVLFTKLLNGRDTFVLHLTGYDLHLTWGQRLQKKAELCGGVASPACAQSRCALCGTSGCHLDIQVPRRQQVQGRGLLSFCFC